MVGKYHLWSLTRIAPCSHMHDFHCVVIYETVMQFYSGKAHTEPLLNTESVVIPWLEHPEIN